MKWCQRCDQLRKDDEVQPIDKVSQSGPGLTIYVCKGGCIAVPIQTAPVSRRGRIRE